MRRLQTEGLIVALRRARMIDGPTTVNLLSRSLAEKFNVGTLWPLPPALLTHAKDNKRINDPLSHYKEINSN